MYIGVDIGGTNVKVGLISKLGRIVRSISFKTKVPRTVDSLIDEIIVTIKQLCKQENLDVKEVEGVGFGIPGTVNSELGIILKAANLKWEGVDFINLFKQKMNVNSKLSNDANCAVVAEHCFGGAKGYKDIVLLTLGTGIGSGIMINNELFEGNGNAGGECGHMVIQYNGERCNCGNRGCWEMYASASALTRQTEKAAKENPNSKINSIIAKYGAASAMTAFEAAKAGDETAQNVVKQYIGYVSCGLLSLTQIFHPEVFVIGGGVSNEGNGLIQPLQQIVNTYIRENNFYPSVEVRKATLGNDAGMIGAACLVMDR